LQYFGEIPTSSNQFYDRNEEFHFNKIDEYKNVNIPNREENQLACRNNGSFETTAAVRCAFILSQASNTKSS
jgi:hypothetical protein